MREAAPLYRAITRYHETCVAFVKAAEEMVAKYNADSAYMEELGPWRDLVGLNFTDANVLPNWVMCLEGCFKPAEATEDSHVFGRKMPRRPADSDGSIITGSRYGFLGQELILSVKSNEDNTVFLRFDADLLDEASLEALKAGASPEQKDYFKTLGRYHWAPEPFAMTSVFTPSEKILKLNKERRNPGLNLWFAIKHAPFVRKIRVCMSGYIGQTLAALKR